VHVPNLRQAKPENKGGNYAVTKIIRWIPEGSTPSR